ncbi:MAG TPA: TraR/DksA C4-type zinc finger protein [Cerasibacillus sp.]|uniref:TraR/DksA C4-type zinc finger protein n=1 Tax=Cerasibacillus sp. TaxID=2498711 RepID=UPI002F414602
MLSDTERNHLKATLVERQNELIPQIQDHYGLENAQRQTTGELSNYDNHPGDLGTETYERGKDLALNEHAERELEDINRALHAIEEGSYGICVECGEDIPYERLEAVPTTNRCIEHASNAPYENARPVEEQVFSPNINPDNTTPEKQVGYDAEDAWQEVSQYGTSETPSDFFGDRKDYNEMYPNKDDFVGFVEGIENMMTSTEDGDILGTELPQNKLENYEVIEEE